MRSNKIRVPEVRRKKISLCVIIVLNCVMLSRIDLLGVGHAVALDVQVVLADRRQIQETLGDGKVQIDQAQELNATFPTSQKHSQVSRESQ